MLSPCGWRHSALLDTPGSASYTDSRYQSRADLCLLVATVFYPLGGKHATRCSPSRLLTNRVALIFIFFSDASRHPASYEIGSGENSSTYYVTLRERLLDKIIDARRKFTICYTDVPYYKGSTSCRNHREVNLGIGIPL